MGYDGTLTADQQAGLRESRDRWMAAGTCTERCDRERVERLVGELYRAHDLQPPGLVVWVDSPLGGLFAAAVLRDPSLWASLRASLRDSLSASLRASLRDSLSASLSASLRASLSDSLSDSLRASLWDSLWDSLWASLWASLRASLWDSLWDSLSDSLSASLRASLWDSLSDSLSDSLRASLRDSLSDSLRGSQDAYFCAFYRQALDIAGLPAEPKLDAFAALSAEVGWWWPYEGAVILTDRPTVVSFDPDGRLHSDSGPAVAYVDGWAVHSWHGMRVPEWVIAEPTPTRIANEANVEVRRCAIEAYGWDRYLVDTHMTPVASDDWGDLYDMPDDQIPEARVLVVVNGTPERDGTRRRYGLTVPHECHTPLEAVAWSYGLDADEYARLERRT